MKARLTKRADGQVLGIDMSRNDTMLVALRPTRCFSAYDIVNLFNNNYYYHGVFGPGIAIYSKDNYYYYIDCDDWDNNDNYVFDDVACVDRLVFDAGDTVHYDDDSSILHYTDCTVCDNCGEYVPDDIIIYDNYANSVCQRCYNSDYVRCENCECLLRFDEACYCDSGDRSYCRHCYADVRASGCGDLYDYSYKPEPIFFGDDAKFFGIEL